jgi:hypothetical protein
MEIRINSPIIIVEKIVIILANRIISRVMANEVMDPGAKRGIITIDKIITIKGHREIRTEIRCITSLLKIRGGIG